MNDSDKEAFRNWYINKYSEFDNCKEAWQAACEYMKDQFKFQTPPAVIAYQEMNEKLQAENAKLKECVIHYADLEDEVSFYDSRGVSYARQVLKELEDK